LTLRKYVSIDQIVEELRAYDNTLLTYYHDTTVTFSGGDSVNLVDQDTEQVYKKLAARLYKTRNAIVHSKESEKSKYTPFRDDRILIKEIPLIRFVAEQVILSTSTLAT
jgi:hypothetical protein